MTHSKMCLPRWTGPEAISRASAAIVTCETLRAQRRLLIAERRALLEDRRRQLTELGARCVAIFDTQRVQDATVDDLEHYSAGLA